MLDYELGHLAMVRELFKKHVLRDPQEVLNGPLPEPVPFTSQRQFVRDVLAEEVDLRSKGTEYVDVSEETDASIQYRTHLNSQGSPSETVAAGYRWAPGGEIVKLVVNA
jgi:hypothetical protein